MQSEKEDSRVDKAIEPKKPRTINKRGQGRDIYNNKARRLLEPTTYSERNFRDLSKTKSKDELYGNGIPLKTKAEISTLRHYFDDEWFDDEFYLRTERLLKSRNDNYKKKGTYYQPMRCPKCRRPFQKTVDARHNSGHVYLNTEVFTNVPLIKKKCHGC